MCSEARTLKRWQTIHWEDHLLGKMSWLHAFSCVTVYGLSVLMTESAFYWAYYLVFPFSVLNMQEEKMQIYV